MSNAKGLSVYALVVLLCCTAGCQPARKLSAAQRLYEQAVAQEQAGQAIEAQRSYEAVLTTLEETDPAGWQRDGLSDKRSLLRAMSRWRLGDERGARAELAGLVDGGVTQADSATRWWAHTLDLHLQALQIEQRLPTTRQTQNAFTNEDGTAMATSLRAWLTRMEAQAGDAPDGDAERFALQARLHGWYVLRRALHRMHNPPARFSPEETLAMRSDLERLRIHDEAEAHRWAQRFGVVLQGKSTR